MYVPVSQYMSSNVGLSFGTQTVWSNCTCTDSEVEQEHELVPVPSMAGQLKEHASLCPVPENKERSLPGEGVDYQVWKLRANALLSG